MEKARRKASWEMMFEDNVALCTESGLEAEEKLEVWRNSLEERSYMPMVISRKKRSSYMPMEGMKQDKVINLQDVAI